MKKTFVFVVLFFYCSISLTYASSSYVLPYPSVMPGGIAYKLHILLEKVQQYWYFGDFGQVTYNLKESDKYLVEAKVLFEYQQYLLGLSALHKSNVYFQQTFFYLQKAQGHNKNIVNYRKTLALAAQKHSEVLTQLKGEVPGTVVWSPEKEKSTTINISQEIIYAIQIRQKYYE